MGWVQADVDAVKAGIATGTLSVRLADGRQITRPSVAEQLRLLAVMEADVALTAGQQPVRHALAAHAKDIA